MQCCVVQCSALLCSAYWAWHSGAGYATSVHRDRGVSVHTHRVGRRRRVGCAVLRACEDVPVVIPGSATPG